MQYNFKNYKNKTSIDKKCNVSVIYTDKLIPKINIYLLTPLIAMTDKRQTFT